jgi:hypothetical protein
MLNFSHIDISVSTRNFSVYQSKSYHLQEIFLFKTHPNVNNLFIILQDIIFLQKYSFSFDSFALTSFVCSY